MFLRVKKLQMIILFVLLTLIMISVATALAAANNVPVTRLADQSRGLNASELAPPECNSIRAGLETVIVCMGGNCNGSKGNELILGTAGNDVIDGKNGNDCIVGGDGDDLIFGDNDNDVLVGGPGSDILDGGKRNKDTDICVDSPSSTFVDCEIVR
jgi:Ca2+-binding RTX toxin-like protein